MDTTKSLLAMVYDAIQAGAAGIAFGRNVFQHSNPVQLVQALALVVHQNYEVSEAVRETGLQLD
jgi:DhnA family fructose-bisphosphate aldolase class Ia